MDAIDQVVVIVSALLLAVSTLVNGIIMWRKGSKEHAANISSYRLSPKGMRYRIIGVIEIMGAIICFVIILGFTGILK